MSKKILLGVMFSIFAAAVFAQSPKPTGFKAPDPDMLAAQRGLLRSQKASGPTAEDVGDVDSFGRNMTYLGVQQTETVLVYPDCSVFPDFTCVELPADLSQTTNVDEMDLAAFELPANSTNSLICFTVTMFSDWFWQNTTGTQESATMFVNPTFQIESDVLDGLTDPDGNPFNGKLYALGPAGLSTFLQYRSLDAGEFEFNAPRLTRSCTGGLVSTRVLVDAFGLTEKQAEDFFKGPLTVSFGVRGSISSVTDASFSYGIRLYGD